MNFFFRTIFFFLLHLIKKTKGFHMRYHFFLYYGWFLQNLRKDFIRTNMHTTVVLKPSPCAVNIQRIFPFSPKQRSIGRVGLVFNNKRHLTIGKTNRHNSFVSKSRKFLLCLETKADGSNFLRGRQNKLGHLRSYRISIIGTNLNFFSDFYKVCLILLLF